MTSRRHFLKIALGTGSAVVVAACTPSAPSPSAPAAPGQSAPATAAPASAAARRKVTFGISTTQFLEDTANYTSLPNVLGFWNDDGLDVTPVGVSGSATNAQLIVSGQHDAGVPGTSDGVYVTRSKGLRITAFYNLVNHSFQDPAVPEASPIQTVADFKGKTIGVQSLSSGTVPVVRAYLSDAGLDPDKDVTFVAVGLGGQAAAALFESHQIDILSLWDGQYASIENTTPRYKLRVIRPALGERLGFQVALAATDDKLASDRAVMVGLGRGVAKATVFALANPEAAVRLHWKAFPDARPHNVSDADAVERGVRTMLARLNNERIDTAQPPRTRWGFADPQEVQTFYDVLRRSNSITGELNLNQLYTNDLIEEINRFDVAAIQSMAKTYTL
jgi:NitT/TauT family transport system substrate-binding protein